ncbi:energy transducer TonB [Brevundimonas vesicularis]|uniref:energy transducer TonB n=1 Tax=Brevundimonas vesicularis TaxID=41276 RepID=UPI0015716AF9|nr:energy transducer TonB [Brevundimonas vesicularis]NSX32933.1 energy transducer TonB [Brevundimonas vesicularis]
MRAILFGLGLALTMTAPGWAQAPVVRHQSATSPEQVVFLIPSTDIQCDGQAVKPTFSDDLRVETTGPSRADRTSVSLSFSVDDTGRTFDIRAPRTATPSNSPIIIPTGIGSEHEQAALAAWRFDGPRRDCIMTIRYTAKPFIEATTGDLLRYFAVTRTRGPIRDAVAVRLAGPDANCGEERRGGRAPRTVSYPDYKIGQRPPPGGRSWTVVRWDVDADGRAVNVETLGSAGDTAFDAETRRAVSETFVESGAPLKGCVFNFYRYGENLRAPVMQQTSDDPLQNCPPEVGARFQARATPETYPQAFRDRGIEGWARVRFDFATWGQIGNVGVIDAQPASAFGESGVRVVQTSRADSGFQAGVRCVAPVRYVLSQSPGDGASSTSVNAAD